MVPIIVLATMNHLKLSLILLLMSVVLAIMQDIATLLVSRRFGHFYSLRDYISVLLFLPIEVILYRVTGLLFVTIGTILYFFDKDGWSRSERIGQPIMLDMGVKASVKDTLGG
jgi:poly-beta-1,6-N-acetyl-D-glucosamine synthase